MAIFLDNVSSMMRFWLYNISYDWQQCLCIHVKVMVLFVYGVCFSRPTLYYFYHLSLKLLTIATISCAVPIYENFVGFAHLRKFTCTFLLQDIEWEIPRLAKAFTDVFKRPPKGHYSNTGEMYVCHGNIISYFVLRYACCNSFKLAWEFKQVTYDDSNRWYQCSFSWQLLYYIA